MLYHHHADFRTCLQHRGWKILEVWVNACWVYSVESDSKMLLVPSITFLIFLAICGVVYVKLTHSSLGDREDIFKIHLIIINKSEVSIFSHGCHILRECVPWVVVSLFAVDFIYILVKVSLGFFYCFAVLQKTFPCQSIMIAPLRLNSNIIQSCAHSQSAPRKTRISNDWSGSDQVFINNPKSYHTVI